MEVPPGMEGNPAAAGYEGYDSGYDYSAYYGYADGAYGGGEHPLGTGGPSRRRGHREGPMRQPAGGRLNTSGTVVQSPDRRSPGTMLELLGCRDALSVIRVLRRRPRAGPRRCAPCQHNCFGTAMDSLRPPLASRRTVETRVRTLTGDRPMRSHEVW